MVCHQRDVLRERSALKIFYFGRAVRLGPEQLEDGEEQVDDRSEGADAVHAQCSAGTVSSRRRHARYTTGVTTTRMTMAVHCAWCRPSPITGSLARNWNRMSWLMA